MFDTLSDGKTCEDIDECLLDNGLCQQICINKVGLCPPDLRERILLSGWRSRVRLQGGLQTRG